MSRSCFAKAHTDSTAALAIPVGESASWKTRHLRRRAKSLRWRITCGDWCATWLELTCQPTSAPRHSALNSSLMDMDEVELEKPTLSVQKPGVANDAKLKRVLMSVVSAAQIMIFFDRLGRCFLTFSWLFFCSMRCTASSPVA